MFNEKVYGLVKKSILSDRNMKAGNVTEIKINKTYIELTIEDNADKIKIKRETKENLKTYWNISMMNNHVMKQFIERHHITFTEFRTEFEKIIKDIHGELDLDSCVDKALTSLSSQKLTSNTSRVERSDNAGKKAAEIHKDKKEEKKEDGELKEEEEKGEIEKTEESEVTEGEKELTREEKQEVIKKGTEMAKGILGKKKAGRPPKKQPASGV